MSAPAPTLPARPAPRRITRPARALRRRSPVSTQITGGDFFCGWGGSAQGIIAAGVDLEFAANHDKLAIECSSLNNPHVDHRRADLTDLDNARFADPANFPYATFVWFSPSCRHHSQANAKRVYAQGPSAIDDDADFDEEAYANSERSRTTMLCPLRYAAANMPESMVIENVVEAAKWGPNKNGATFRWWLSEWDLLGYEYKVLFLNSQFFPPTPQSRDRMYVVLWRKGNKAPDLEHRPQGCCTSDICQGEVVTTYQWWKPKTAAWPLDQWGKYGAQYFYRCTVCDERVEPLAFPAITAIDWSNLGPRLGDRAKLPKHTTLERIRLGCMKFQGDTPLIIPAKATWGTDRPVTMPLTTQTTVSEKALVTKGFVVKNNGPLDEAQYRAVGLGQPLGTVTAHPTQALATNPFTFEMRGGGSVLYGQHPTTDPLHTVTAGGLHHGLANIGAMFQKINGAPGDTAWHGVADPLGTITSRDTTGLVVFPWVEQFNSNPVAVTKQLATLMTHGRHSLASVDRIGSVEITYDELMGVRFRMLQPHELMAAMAFDPNYQLIGTKEQRTCGLGNAVTPPVATWVTARVVAALNLALAA